MLNPNRISESTGTAFRNSGQVLAAMRKDTRMAFVTGDVGSEGSRELLSASVLLLDDIVSRWSSVQAQSISLMLLGMNQQEAAEELGVTQSNVQQAIQRARWQPVKEFLMAFEKRL